MNERNQLRGFVLTVLDFVDLPVSDSDLGPIRKCNDLRGLRVAAADMVEICQDLDAQQVEQLDLLLRENGYPTLSEMRNHDLRRLRKILSQNRIVNDDDWRFVESYLSDVDSEVLTDKDRDVANRILVEYKSR
jgi:hypothetical protein